MGTVLTEFGVTDAISVKLDDRWGTWGVLELWRCSGRFSHVERDRFVALGPGVSPSRRVSVAPTFTVPDARPPRLESGVVLVDDLEVHSVTSGAAHALMRLLPPTEPGRQCRRPPTTWSRPYSPTSSASGPVSAVPASISDRTGGPPFGRNGVRLWSAHGCGSGGSLRRCHRKFGGRRRSVGPCSVAAHAKHG